MSYPFVMRYDAGVAINGIGASKYYMNLNSIGQQAFGRVIALDSFTGDVYVGFLYQTAAAQTSYIMKLDANLGQITVSTIGGISTVSEI